MPGSIAYIDICIVQALRIPELAENGKMPFRLDNK
jgi:hypothetical protein